MSHGATDERADTLLRAVRDDRDYANEIEVQALANTVRWLTEVSADCVPLTEATLGSLNDLPVGGNGCPAVPEEAIAEFAAVAGMSDHAARCYLADAWNLQWRLPHTFVAMRSQTLPVWKARAIAAATHGLSAEAASFVDQTIAARAHKVGPVQLKRLVTEAEALFDPVAAELRAEAAAERRRVELYPPFEPTGIMDLVASLDHADARDVEAALQSAASDLDPVDSLDVRRSKALGVIARSYLAGHTRPDGASAPTRVVHLYAHLVGDQPLATLEAPAALVPVQRIAEWCATAGTDVTVRPVIDLSTHRSRDGYVPTSLMREAAMLINPTCVHPHCTRPARKADLDHIEAYRLGGPPGQTSTENLAPLCRRHHRLKTHGDWHYECLEPGIYLWHSPSGAMWLRTREGTVELRPRPQTQRGSTPQPAPA